MNGLINLYKPSGMSSAQAVGRVRHILGEKSVGHMGTLDPMAQGVLLIGVGRSTRLFDYLINKKKTYIAKFKFGYATDTLDALGTTVATTDDIPSVDAVLHALTSLIGESEQLPPAFSAKHVNGRRAYDLARKGEEVQLTPVRVTVYDAQLVCQPAMNEFVVSVTCSAGTYIRSVCRDVAKMCGSLATLTYLERTACGKFDVTNSLSFEAIELRKGDALVPPYKALELPTFTAEDGCYDDLCYGRAIPCEREGEALVFCKGEFWGIGRAEGGKLKIKTLLKDR